MAYYPYLLPTRRAPLPPNRSRAWAGPMHPNINADLNLPSSSNYTSEPSDTHLPYSLIIRQDYISIKDDDDDASLNWSKKWVVLRERDITFQKKKNSEWSSTLVLGEITNLERVDSKPLCFLVESKDRQIYFFFRDESELSAWLFAIYDRSPLNRHNLKVSLDPTTENSSGLPEQQTRLLTSSSIMRKDYTRNYPAVSDTMGFYKGHQMQEPKRLGDSVPNAVPTEGPITKAQTSQRLPTPKATTAQQEAKAPNISLEMLMKYHAPMNLSGQVVISDYENPAQGGLADVYTGLLGDELVAVKRLRTRRSNKREAYWEASNERRMKREMHVWAALKHPNISEFLGYSTNSDRYPDMISTWYQRGTVSEYLEHHPVSTSDRLKLALDVNHGLEYLHRLKIIHGDLKPSNVLVDDGCVGRLCDFGLVRLAEWEGPAGMTTTSPYTGTERYKPPELFITPDNRRPVATFEGDIYSLGCILLEFIERIYPFQRFRRSDDLRDAIMDRHAPALRKESTKALADLTEYFWNLLEVCWGESFDRPGIAVVVDALEYFSRELQNLS